MTLKSRWMDGCFTQNQHEIVSKNGWLLLLHLFLINVLSMGR